MGRSLQHISNGLRSLQGRNPQGAPRIPIRLPLLTNLNHFYPVAERGDSCVNPAGGIDLVAAGICSTEYGYTKVCTQ